MITNTLSPYSCYPDTFTFINGHPSEENLPPLPRHVLGKNTVIHLEGGYWSIDIIQEEEKKAELHKKMKEEGKIESKRGNSTCIRGQKRKRA
jgi:hypothetical protein